MAKTQMQLSTNKRVLTAADDPIASARALEVTQSQSMNTQFVTNRTQRQGRRCRTRSNKALQDGTSLLQDVADADRQAGNGTLSDSERGMLATELEGAPERHAGRGQQQRTAPAPTCSPATRRTTQPFPQTAAGVAYQGDQGQRVLQVGSARKMAISETGSAVFENIPTGNGSFQLITGSANTGSGIIRQRRRDRQHAS